MRNLLLHPLQTHRILCRIQMLPSHMKNPHLRLHRAHTYRLSLQ